MTAKPRKPLLVNLTWAVCLTVILLVLYVGAYVGSWWLVGADLLPEPVWIALDATVFAPLIEYENSDWPGARLLSNWCDRATWAGKGAE
jgi:hypothetical protein